MDASLHHILVWIDPILIAPYRLTGHSLINFFIGSFCLAMIAVVAGELTLSGAIRFNRGQIDALNEEISRKEALSLHAYAAGNRDGYKALNREANDAWGRHFFNMAAYSAGMLWPIPLALAWMHSRFADIDFLLAWPLNRLLGESVGYPFIFIPVYILCRMIFGRIRRWLPYFSKVQRELDATGRRDPQSSTTERP
jgi:hypothetical protein